MNFRNGVGLVAISSLPRPGAPPSQGKVPWPRFFPSLCLNGNSPPAGLMVDSVRFGGCHEEALTAISVAALIGTPAFAADMAVKAPPPAPAPVYSWTGWYVGVNAGASFGNVKTDFNVDPITVTITGRRFQWSRFCCLRQKYQAGSSVAARSATIGSIPP